MSFVAGVAAGSINGTSVSTLFPGINTTGSTIIRIQVSSQWPATVVGDSVGNVYSPRAIYGSTVLSQTLYCLNPTTDPNQTFVVVAVGPSGQPGYPAIVVDAFNGGPWLFDSENGNAATAATIQTGAVVPTHPGSLILAGLCVGSLGSEAIDSGFAITQIPGVAGQSMGAAGAYLIQAVPAIVDPTWSVGGASQCATGIVVFKPTGSPPTVACPVGGGAATIGVFYSKSLVASGGSPPYTYLLVGGSLPPGLNLNSTTGVVSGTPTAIGTYTYAAQVIDAASQSSSVISCSILVSTPTLSLFCPPSTAFVGIFYYSTLVASGGVPPYTFTIISGSLPPGLSINYGGTPGIIGGTPTAPGTYPYTAKVTDSVGATATVSCTFNISNLAVSCVYGVATIGFPYSSFFVGSGGTAPYTYSISSGTLPAGLSLNGATGAVTGIPTTLGTSPYTVRVTDATTAIATSSCSIRVAPTGALTVVCPSGTYPISISFAGGVAVTGGVAPYAFALTSGTLPPGLTLNVSTGTITGTPTTAGTYPYTVTVTDAVMATGSGNGTLIISNVVVACAYSFANVGTAYSSALVGFGGAPPYTFAIVSGSLPPGLSLNGTTGAITGTPTTAAVYSYTAQITDSASNTSTSSCHITVSGITLACASSTATVGSAYSSSLVAAMGIPPYTYSISAGFLPPGLMLNGATGLISGTPAVGGVYPYTAKVVDSVNDIATASCSITSTGVSLRCASSFATLGAAYSSSLLGAGGSTPYTYAITGGSLPPGLGLDTATGIISGTPTMIGNYAYTARVTDAATKTANVSCSITVGGLALAVGCPIGELIVGVPASISLPASGGDPPYTFALIAGPLPMGLAMSSAGIISGTPTVIGSYQYTVSVTDANANTAIATCIITVGQGVPAFTLTRIAVSLVPAKRLPVRGSST